MRYKKYPPHQSQRGGIKVGWLTYAKYADAKKCAEAAKHNAAIKISLGYDFGYQAPGCIEKVAGGWEVVVP